MPNDTYTVTLTEKEFIYILAVLKDDQKDLSFQGSSFDFLNHLVAKLDSVLYKEV